MLSIAPYTFLPATSGGQRAVYYLYQHIGKQVQLFCVSTDSNQVDQGKEALQFTLLPILGRSFSRYFNPRNYFKIKAQIEKHQIEAILIEHPYLGWLGWLLKITTGLPLVIRSHNIEALRFKTLGKWWWRILADYERWIHKKANHSFFITQEDADYAIAQYSLDPAKTSVLTYGMELGQTLSPTEKKAATLRYKELNQIPAAKTLLLFNGIFGYPPNDEALELLLEKIYPAILRLDPNFFLIICGGNIPEQYMDLKDKNKWVIGFVPDIQEVYQATEIFLNPIWLGGGIKTKLVEALAAGAAAVSFDSGAIGIDPGLLNGKLQTVSDKDIDGFAKAVINATAQINTPVPTAFLDYFDWDQIASKAGSVLQSL